MIPYVIRPLSDRAGLDGPRKAAPFRATWRTTRADLDRELRALQARHVALEVDVGERDIRVDGELRADARPRSPAVRLAFDSKHGPLQYGTGAFWQWTDNVRAIALGLEALRRVDRYGISRRGEQYAGWRAITAGPVALGAGPSMSHAEAVAVLRAAAGVGADYIDTAGLIRAAQAAAHPDRNGGDRTVWDQVERAVGVVTGRA